MDWLLYDRDLRHEWGKPTFFFINSRNKKAMKNFWSQLWPYQINVDILLTFSTVKRLSEAYLEPRWASIIKLSCDFCKEAPPGSTGL